MSHPTGLRFIMSQTGRKFHLFEDCPHLKGAQWFYLRTGPNANFVKGVNCHHCRGRILDLQIHYGIDLSNG